MSEQVHGRGAPDFQVGDGLLMLGSKTPGKVCWDIAAEFSDGTKMTGPELIAAWQRGELGWARNASSTGKGGRAR